MMDRKLIPMIMLAVLSAVVVLAMPVDDAEADSTEVSEFVIYYDTHFVLDDWLLGPIYENPAVLTYEGPENFRMQIDNQYFGDVIQIVGADRDISIVMDEGYVYDRATVGDKELHIGTTYPIDPSTPLTLYSRPQVYSIDYYGIEDADNKGNPTTYNVETGFTIKQPTKSGSVFDHWRYGPDQKRCEVEGDITIDDLPALTDLI